MIHRTTILMLLMLAACQQPFGADRHDLLGFRVAAIAAQHQRGALTLRVAVIVDGRPYSREPLDLRWFLLPDARPESVVELRDSATPDAVGPSPRWSWPLDAPAIGLIAEHQGARYHAIVPLDEVPGAPPDLTGIALYGSTLDFTGLRAEDLGLDARREHPLGEPIDAVPVGGFARLVAQISQPERPIRWMATAPSGTFLELDRHATDWAAGSLRFDEDEIEEAVPAEAGVRTVLALALSGRSDSANHWRAREVWIGPSSTGIITPSGRWIGTDRAVDGEAVQGVLVADDDAPTGLSLRDVVAVPLNTDPGTADLPCAAPVSGPFDPDWLLAQRCARSQVVGATVVVALR